jgi:hypothetical protein
VTEDDWYRGYQIPKSAIIIPNIWFVFHHTDVLLTEIYILLTRAMMRDPDNYKDPHAFRPERFLDNRSLDPREAVFGFGRR